jgi:hypothetical protein
MAFELPDLPPAGRADDIQVIPRGTMMYYKGYPFELIEDVQAKSGVSIYRVDQIKDYLHNVAEINRMKFAAMEAEAVEDNSERPPDP